MDKKESMQLAINIRIATVVNSSIIERWEILSSFNEVSTIKHKANRLEEAFRICGDLSLSFDI
jgi:hypothetical protein